MFIYGDRRFSWLTHYIGFLLAVILVLATPFETPTKKLMTKIFQAASKKAPALFKGQEPKC